MRMVMIMFHFRDKRMKVCQFKKKKDRHVFEDLTDLDTMNGVSVSSIQKARRCVEIYMSFHLL